MSINQTRDFQTIRSDVLPQLCGSGTLTVERLRRKSIKKKIQDADGYTATPRDDFAAVLFRSVVRKKSER
jgi:hypothetical protein